MSDSWNGKSSTNWFTTGNWSTGKVPTVTSTGTESIVIGSLANDPVISPTSASGAVMYVSQGGTSYEDYQLDGQMITLTSGADLTLQGTALGNYRGTSALGGTVTGLHGAPSTTPTFDTHMLIEATGTGVDSLFVDDVNHNFGEIEVASGATLNLTVATGGNAQTAHGLYNYGLISIAAGGEFEIGTVVGAGGTVAAFYNPGWIIDDGGTLVATAGIMDGADTVNSAGTPDGYIEIGQSGDVILGSTVSAKEQIDFTDATANTLQVIAGTLFSGTVNDFGPTDTIIVNGFTSTSNATIVTVGGVVELETKNGSVTTTITLTGTTSTQITTGTNSSGQEYIESGGSATQGTTGTTGTIANTGTTTVFGSDTDITVYDSIAGTGAYLIENGATLGLDNAQGNNSEQNIIFGTLGTASSPNTLILNGNSAGFGGHITGFAGNDVVDLGGSVLPALPAGDGIQLTYASGVLTVAETNAAGTVVHSTALSLAGTAALSTSSFVALESTAGLQIELASNVSGDVFTFATTGSFENPADYTGGTAPGDVIASGEIVTIASGTASVSSNALVDNGTITDGGNFTDTNAITGTGTLNVTAGHSATLAAGTRLTAINNFGTIDAAGALSSINMEGNNANSVVDFTGTSTATPLTNFGTTDDIILGTTALPPGAGTGVVLSYNTTNGVLTVEETSATGASLSSAAITVSGTAAGALSTASFEALYGTNGVNIELASSAPASFTFTGASNTSFENPANFTGGITPGNSLASTETVTIASNTASVASGAAIDNGKIIDNATFIDTGSLTGTGTLSVGTGDAATLTGGASLASITDAGTLTLGGTFSGPISLTSGAASITSNFTDTSAITGTGTLTVASGVTATLAASTSLSAINSFGTIDTAGALSSINMEGDQAHSLVDFTGTDVTNGTLTTQLTNFGKSDTIVLGANNFHLTGSTDSLTSSYNSSTSKLVVDDHTSGTVVTLNVALTTGDAPSLISLSTAGGVLDISIPCYASGTRILTTDGEVLVEKLQIGDTVVTVRENGPATAKIVWTGKRSIDIARHPYPDLVRPVRICAGAFGPGVPERDLRLSPHHAVYVDGCLFEAASLLNGVTIVQEQATRHVTYHHIELEAHDVMLAEGMPAESFLDTGNRDMFEDTVAMQLHADFRSPADAAFCVPMVSEGAKLEAVRAMLQARIKTVEAAA